MDSKCERPRENSSESVGSPGNVIVNASTMSVDATAGAVDATAPIAVESDALGIDGSDGADVVVNDGALSVTATATLAIAEFASGGAATGADKGTPEKAKGNEHANDNSRHNGGAPSLPPTAQGPDNANEHSRHGDDEDPSAGENTVAHAHVTGIRSGDGTDRIDNAGPLTATANASISAGNVDFRIVAATPFTATDALAVSTGIDAGAGDDRVRNTGLIDADATADNRAGNFTASLIAPPDAIWNGGAVASSSAAGIVGGDGDDRLHNAVDGEAVGQILVDATATARAGSVNLAGLGIGAMVTSSSAAASAVGIDGGNGADRIRNAGVIGVQTIADAIAIGVGITGLGATSVEDAVFDHGTNARARSVGIGGGDGDEAVANAGTLGADAWASDVTAQGNLTLLGVSAVNAAALAETSAAGMDAGAGADRIRNSGELTATASSLAQSLDAAIAIAGVSLSPSSTGGPFSDRLPEGFGPFADARTVATATTVGIAGGEHDDRIVNASGATLTSRADADTTAAAITATLNSSTTTVVNRLLANTYVDVATAATATATGISGDIAERSVAPGIVAATAPDVPPVDGADRIFNLGTVDVDAAAGALVVEGVFGVEGETMPGVGAAFGVAGG
jgi:hypothetical protein